ncbi:DoxX family protein [Methylobacterium sp. C25]|uniref:DoxX family protein n=1 Tax=Methylobacterium sp. C25 TaxID=2721622 RepID=UPI001F354FD3|nr:DoxX family protein [Methylobacterium sp. C25]
MNAIVRTFIDSPERLSRPLVFLGPLAARLVVGWVFLWSGWTKLHNLPQMIQNFTDWGIPFPEIMTPFVSGVEFVGGLLLLLGLFTRIAGPTLVIVMIVAVISAKLDQVDSLETLLGFEEVSYMALFGWLGVAGPGPLSLDYLLQRMTGSKTAADSAAHLHANPSSQSEPARV